MIMVKVRTYSCGCKEVECLVCGNTITLEGKRLTNYVCGKCGTIFDLVR